MSNIGLLAFQFIPIILGTMILAYTDYKVVGIISVVFGLCCVVYGVSQPCVECCGGEDSEQYKLKISAARYNTMLIFVMGIGFALLIWNFVSRGQNPKTTPTPEPFSEN